MATGAAETDDAYPDWGGWGHCDGIGIEFRLKDLRTVVVDSKIEICGVECVMEG